jgi:hypothetical protein
MQTLKPSICKYDGSRSLCDCTDLNIKEEQRKCITYSRGKRGYCDYYWSDPLNLHKSERSDQSVLRGVWG